MMLTKVKVTVVAKFLFRSILLGTVICVVLVLIISPLLSTYNRYAESIELYQFLVFASSAFAVGVTINLFYLTPLHLVARTSLRSIAVFYKEFLLFGAKYFAKENPNRPFELVVEVKVSETIRMLGFVTNKLSNGSTVVFIPTSRRLTAGFNLIVDDSILTETEIKPEAFLKYIMTNGAFPLIQP